MNARAEIVSNSVRAISKRLSGPTDLLDLYAHLSEGGTRPDTLLFEAAEGPSVLLDQAALRIQCRGGEVVVDAMTSNGGAVLRLLGRSFTDRVVAQRPDQICLRFERVQEVDAEKRLMSPSPFDVLRTILSDIRNETLEEPMAICLLGVTAFDHVDLFEDLPPSAEDPTGFPDFVYWLGESFIVIDPGTLPRIVCTAFSAGSGDERKRSLNGAIERLGALAERAADMPRVKSGKVEASDIAVDVDDAAFSRLVMTLKDHVFAGDVYQIVPSRTFSASCPDPLSAFARLRAIDRSPYMVFARLEDYSLFGASPETSVRISAQGEDRVVEVRPIAGTRPRGPGALEDDRMEADLRLDAKEVAEHMMLVDLARNDVARISRAGTRHVAELMRIEKYARVMHLVSSVKGELAERYDALHALQACLNVGTLSGAPKLKATELLRTHEKSRRGPYGGAIGWLNGEGLMDTAVIIRSAFVRDGVAYVRAGAGVVHDSDPRAEADETRRKASAVLSAIAGACS